MGFKVTSKINKDAISDQLKMILFKSMMKMQELATINCPVDTGRLRNSINLQPPVPGSSKYVLSEGTEYGAALEFGTSPHFTSVNNLKGWSRRVLRDENAAFAIKAKIAKFGTEAQPFFRPALDQVKLVWVPRYFNEILGKKSNKV